MRFRFLTMLSVSVTALALASCSGGSGFGGGGGKKDEAPKKQTEQNSGSGSGSGSGSASVNPQENETEAADEPAMVAGAFLTCGPAEDSPDAASGAGFGCVFRDGAAGAKLKAAPTEPVATIALDNGSSLNPPMKGAPDDSAWHYHFKIDANDLPHVKSLEIRAKLEGKVFKRKTERMDEHPDGEPGGAPAQPERPVKPPAGQQRMFVTTATFVPGRDFRNVLEADERCAIAGSKVSFKPVNGWYAYLFSSKNSQVTSFYIDEGIADVKGKVLFADQEAFWNPTQAVVVLPSPVLTESGSVLPSESAFAWTGLSEVAVGGGTPADLTVDVCSDWSTEKGTGVVGHTTPPFVDDGGEPFDWLYVGQQPCASDLHLLCISQ